MSESIAIDWSRVEMLARRLRELPLAHDFPAQVVRVSSASDEDCFRAFLAAASICHSTRGGLRGTRGKSEYNGWDLLLEAFTTWAENEPHRLDPSVLKQVDEDDLRRLLEMPFDSATVTLNDLDRRAAILRDLQHALETRFEGRVTRVLEQCGHRVGGSQGAYAVLRSLPGFGDPLEKKSSAFLMAAHFSGRWTIDDQENVRAMIDYHRMRLLLRTGCIVTNDKLANQLVARERVGDVDARGIRAAAMEICSAIPGITGMPVFDFDVLLWALARSACRHRPLCVNDGPENDSFYEYTGLPRSAGCVLADFCPGAQDLATRSLWEPQIETEDY